MRNFRTDDMSSCHVLDASMFSCKKLFIEGVMLLHYILFIFCLNTLTLCQRHPFQIIPLLLSTVTLTKLTVLFQFFLDLYILSDFSPCNTKFPLQATTHRKANEYRPSGMLSSPFQTKKQRKIGITSFSITQIAN